MITDISSEITQAISQRKTFKEKRKIKIGHSRILYPVKLSIKNEGEVKKNEEGVKTFSNKQKIRKPSVSKSVL